MGTYNRIELELTCPRCHAESRVPVDLHFGDTRRMVTLALGDEYPFHPRRLPHNGGPPTAESPYGLGYALCPSCRRDFFCRARIEDGRLVAIEVDLETPPYIPDRTEPGQACTTCGAETIRQRFDAMVVSRLVCTAGCPQRPAMPQPPEPPSSRHAERITRDVLSPEAENEES